MSFWTSVKRYELDRVSVVGQQQKANRVESNNLRQQTAQTLQDSLQVGLRGDGAGDLEQGPIPAVRCASRFRLANRHIQKGCLLEGHDTFRGSIPSFFMREIRVVRLISIRAAAPSVPATRPSVIFSTRTISSRSFASRVPATGVVLPLLLSSPIGACSDVPWVRITERSMKFSSSRIFPGQCQLESFLMAAAGIDSISLFIRRPCFWMK